MPGPRVFHTPSGVAFLPALADALLDGRLTGGARPADDPFALSDATIFLPTRRAARVFSRLLTERLGGAALLPRLAPLGAIEDEETSLLGEEGPIADDAATLPPAVDPIERRLTLARLTFGWAERLRHAIVSVDAAGEPVLDETQPMLVAAGPLAAWRLAGALGELIDELVVAGLPPRALADLGESEFDRYWGVTLHFLRIAFESWPAHLVERGLMDAAARRAALIAREVERLAGGRAPGPVIAAGSTGAHAATADLLVAIAGSPRGAIVLPGLDTDLDAAAWAMIGAGDDPVASHPQAGLRRLLERLGIDRAAVVPLAAPPPALARRARLVSRALRPAETTERWAEPDAELPPAAIADALKGLAVIEAGDEREEALAIAIVMREALERPGETLALATPDRGLAARVSAELRRWGVEVEDSAGATLAATAAGGLARLALAALNGGFAGAPLLALLRHPLVRLGKDAAAHAGAVDRLEMEALRGADPVNWLADAASALEDARQRAEARGPTRADDWRALADLLAAVSAALAPLGEVGERAGVGAWAAGLADTLARLRALPDDETAPDEETEPALADLLDALAAAPLAGPSFSGEEFAELLAETLAGEPARRRARGHPRLAILGLLEARLLSHDAIILGGLDEGVWPPSVETGPFLNRPMRARLGLAPPERRIGQTAHDFAQALGHPRVVVTRAARRARTPTVASRFLLRLATVAGASAWDACRARGRVWLDLAAALERAPPVPPIGRPMPKPPVALRPFDLTMTQVETLRRDPYAFHAARILRLRPLEPLDADGDARRYGEAMHEALYEWTLAAERTPKSAERRALLDECAREHLAPLFPEGEFERLRMPGLSNALDAVFAWDEIHRAGRASVETEISGKLALPLKSGRVASIAARADRLERDKGGGVRLADFKTGGLPRVGDVSAGFSPQLTLEAAMALRGAFGGAKARMVAAGYVRIGAREAEIRNAAGKRGPPIEELARAHLAGLVALLEWLENADSPYVAEPWPGKAPDHGDYRALSRVAEWSAFSGEDGSGE